MGAFVTSRKGSVLVLCLMVLAVLSVFCLWAGKIASLNQKTAFNHVRQLQSLYLAEAGIDLSLAAIRENPLWRGDDPAMAPAVRGTLDLKGVKGTYSITICDATDDGNGKWDSRLPGGMLILLSEGACAEAYQSLSCRIKLSPSTEKTDVSPRIAVISAGDITVAGGTQAISGLDEGGHENITMIRGNTVFPKMNAAALKAMADEIVGMLDDEVFPECLSTRNTFWRDSPADKRPYITCVTRDMILSGDKTLYGIFFVEGDRVSLSGEVRLNGVLYAPNAQEVTIPGEDGFGSPSIRGQVVAGAGGVKSTGGAMGVRLVGEYVEAFSDVGGAPVVVSIVPGSWHRP
jgi:hypothetical protein